MKVTIEKPQIITLVYKQERSDADYGSCQWARFYFDTQNYTMSIESDCGNYSYGWVPTPNTESFLELLCRMNHDYLLRKLAERTVVDGDATWAELRERLEDLEVQPDADVLQDLKDACYHKRSDRDVYDAIAEAVRYTPLEKEIGGYDIYECICMDYDNSAKKIVSVFLSAIVPVLKEMEDKHG